MIETKNRPGDTWKPVDLAALLNDGYEPPVPTVGVVPGAGGLFYEGRINQVFGDSGGGKTWFMVWVAAEQMRAGNDVLFVDFEDQPAATVARLEQVGVSRTVILKHLVYVQPHERWTKQAQLALQEGLEGRTITVAVIDSTGESMATDGVNSNSDDEVARWFRGAPRMLANLGAAVVLLDHVPKNQATGRNVDFSIGSQRKRAAVNGASYFLDVISAPSREEDGKFKLIARKDRFGYRKHGTVACLVEMNNHAEGDGLDFVVTASTRPTGPEGGFAPTWYMERVSQVLEDLDEGIGVNEIERRVGKKSSYVNEAIRRLVSDGYVKVEDGPRRSKLHTSVRAYRQDAPDSDASDASDDSFF